MICLNCLGEKITTNPECMIGLGEVQATLHQKCTSFVCFVVYACFNSVLILSFFKDYTSFVVVFLKTDYGNF